ncbi:hypothetical protein [Sphingosinithalassobacter portus]|uniref:hypothetical protein n=1 Tax=Stakelama portus TaxID=2676234 RepID=UPI000D6E07AC|nr:hypothetical protein [Sphingosinithalassobacter portus]
MMRSVFAIPAILAVTSLFGLIVALTGEGWRDVLGIFALSLPLLAVAHAWTKASQTRSSARTREKQRR